MVLRERPAVHGLYGVATRATASQVYGLLEGISIKGYKYKLQGLLPYSGTLPRGLGGLGSALIDPKFYVSFAGGLSVLQLLVFVPVLRLLLRWFEAISVHNGYYHLSLSLLRPRILSHLALVQCRGLNITRTGFWGPLFYTCNKEPPKIIVLVIIETPKLAARTCRTPTRPRASRAAPLRTCGSFGAF